MKNEFRALSELVTSLPQPLNLSISQLSSLPLPSERARQKFLGVGGCPCKFASEIFSRFSDFYTHLFPPSTFLLLRPNASKNAAIARFCSRSCKRNLVQVVATRVLTPLMARLVWDRGPTDSFWRKFPKMGGGPPNHGNSVKSRKSIKCIGK